jgi:hypothetical protein
LTLRLVGVRSIIEGSFLIWLVDHRLVDHDPIMEWTVSAHIGRNTGSVYGFAGQRSARPSPYFPGMRWCVLA